MCQNINTIPWSAVLKSAKMLIAWYPNVQTSEFWWFFFQWSEDPPLALPYFPFCELFLWATCCSFISQGQMKHFCLLIHSFCAMGGFHITTYFICQKSILCSGSLSLLVSPFLRSFFSLFFFNFFFIFVCGGCFYFKREKYKTETKYASYFNFNNPLFWNERHKMIFFPPEYCISGFFFL